MPVCRLHMCKNTCARRVLRDYSIELAPAVPVTRGQFWPNLGNSILPGVVLAPSPSRGRGDEAGQSQMRPSRDTFVKPSAELLRTAEDLRAQRRTVEAGKFGFAAFMHATTRGQEQSRHGKLLLPQYSLSQADQDKAMLLWTDAIQKDPEQIEEFTDWFNEACMVGGAEREIGNYDIAWEELRRTIERGDLNALRQQISLTVGSGLLNKLGRNGSLLELACGGPVEAVRILLSAGANPALAGPHGSTALHTSAYFGRVDALRLLLNALQQAAIHPDLADERGNTPLVAASANTAESSVKQRKACVRMLLDAGADAAKAFNTGAHESVLQMLGAAAGASIDERGVKSATAHSAAQVQAAKYQWNDAMERAVDAGVLTKKELKELRKPLAQVANDARRAQLMEEQLEDLKACKLGDRATLISTGCLVGLHSLEAKPELNGSRGRVISYEPAKGRYAVELQVVGADGERPRMLLKPRNVEPAELTTYDEAVSQGIAGTCG